MQNQFSIAHELAELQKLHAEGHLTRLEYDDAKRILLTKHAPPVAPPLSFYGDTAAKAAASAQIAPALPSPAGWTFDEEMARVETEWAAARRKYMIRPKGQDERFAPKESMGGRIAVVSSITGLFVLVFLLTLGQFAWTWPCVIATVGAPILYAVTSQYKMAYDAALARYQEQKRAVHARHNRPISS